MNQQIENFDVIYDGGGDDDVGGILFVIRDKFKRGRKKDIC